VSSAWRDPAQVASWWEGASQVDPARFRASVRGRFWEALGEAGGALLVTREYEHLLVALRVGASGPETTFLPLPHPSGIAVDRARGLVHVASTRNPNQLVTLAPAGPGRPRTDLRLRTRSGRPLLPLRTRFLPGCLYLHDLALVGTALMGNAVGENAVVRLDGEGTERAWWPRSVETPQGPLFSRNVLQLNSIAAGPDLASSFFTASAAAPGRRRPGQPSFPVDRRGVLFSGATREPTATGLTRPHSARFHRGRVWLDDSGYGTFGPVAGGRLEVAARLPGWTRGLCFRRGVAFVGTSRILPRFSAYAPGLAPEKSLCGLHAVETRSGRLLGSLLWPRGDQIFGVEWLPPALGTGLPLRAGRRGPSRSDRDLFYAAAAGGQDDR
jgi:hypothetical protein